VTISLPLPGDPSGNVKMLIPRGEMKLQLVSPALRGGLQ